MSPHLIPHRSLHSLSGTVSQALKVHGPNFGSGGGPHGAADALLTAAALLNGSRLPGVWVVLTGWDPEPATDAAGQVLSQENLCNAVALALVPTLSATRITLRVVPASLEPRRNGHGGISVLSLEGLLRVLSGAGPQSATVVWQLPGGERLEVERHHAAASNGLAARHALRGTIDRWGGEAVVTRNPATWITGVGAATPLGLDYATIADGLLAGRSGVRRVQGFDVAEHPSQIAGQLDHVPCPPSQDAADFAGLPRLEQLVLWCCDAALRDAGWWERRSRVRFGLVLGVGAEWLVLWEEDALRGGTRVHDPAQDSESLVQHDSAEAGTIGTGGERVGGVCQRQLRPGPGAKLAGNGLGGRVPGRCLRHGGHADVAGRLRQPARPVAAQRRAVSGLTSLRPGPRRLRHGRGRRHVRSRTGCLGPPAFGSRLRPRRRLRGQQRRP